MTEQAVGQRLQDVGVLRTKAEEALRSRIAELFAEEAATKLKAVGEEKFTLDQILGVSSSLTRLNLADLFLEQGEIPAENKVSNTANRRAPLIAAAAKLAVGAFDPAEGRVFRDDGRNPWKIVGFGFKHRTIAQDTGTVAQTLRAVAATSGIASWAHNYHLKNDSEGVPTISTALLNEGSGASNSGWQYAISVPPLPNRFDVQALTQQVLGGPNKPGGENDNTVLLMDADTVDAASVIAIQGGPMNEFTFLSAIKPEWVVGFRRLNFAAGEEWRVPFERPWRNADQANDIKALLESADEFNFTE